MKNKSIYPELFNFKNLIRSGWKKREIKGRLESDAEHCYSMSILALEYMSKYPNDLDQLKVLKMIAYHDLGELDAGDITPVDNVPVEEKEANELKGIKRLATTYGMPEIETIWLEFQKQETPESHFVRMIDKLDAVKQAKMYSDQQNRPEVFEEFHSRALKVIKPLDDLNL